MANNRNKTAKNRDPLPEHFNSLEEAAEFWDTHDSSEFEDEFEDVTATSLRPRELCTPRSTWVGSSTSPATTSRSTWAASANTQSSSRKS